MKISFKDIEQCCLEMREINLKMTKLVDEISLSCDSLKSGAWTGNASSNYREQFKSVLNNYEYVSDHLTKYINSVERCLSNYKSLESTISTSNSKAIVNPRNVSTVRTNHGV